MTYVETRDGTKLFVKDWGQGLPVILLHGWPLSADMWDAQAMGLAESGYRAIAYDRRGFGRSSQPWAGYNYDALADDLADVISATGAEDATLVGFSMGGGEVARYMSRHGGAGVRSAVLVSSVVPYMLQTSDNPNGVPQSMFDDIGEGIEADRTMTAMMAGLHPTLACADAFAHTDFRPDMASFRVPTLIIHGTADKTAPIDASGRAAAKGISGSRLIEYEGAPHGLNVTHRERLTRDLVEFVAR
ncbi:MAG: alpha/beta hydrolase [Beijerinckiaceae bacterium]|nr:alpha/beta hydrolase [Beijerinckiaceae bacterium]